jgi:putative PIN family toxin of toxin-antitoxin system
MRTVPAAALKVVLDTNIYISAFAYPKGRNAVLWTAARQGKYLLLVSPAIIREIAKVLRRDFAWQDEGVQEAIRLVVQVAHAITAGGSALNVVKADPDDNRILECAVDGKADIIVSNDHHLLDLTSYRHIPIIAGLDFRRTLGMK